MREWRLKTGVAELNLRRLRRTVTVLHRRAPTQYSQDTHDGVYVLPDPLAHQQAAPRSSPPAARWNSWTWSSLLVGIL